MLSACKSIFQLSVCIVALFAVTILTIQFTLFISSSRYGASVPAEGQSTSEGTQGVLAQAIFSAIVDVLLLGLFTLQHSAMANPDIRRFISQWWLGAAERSFYVLATAVSLMLLIFNWQPIPWYMWQLTNDWLLSACFLLHCCIWTIIYGGCLQMDLPEMIGVKQVYYKMMGSTDPIYTKNPGARQLYSHMRHPSFIGFCALFWLTPVMSADRLLLAAILTVYMALAWNVDGVDYQYQKEQLRKKKYDLGLAY